MKSKTVALGGSFSMEFQFISAGEFLMGSPETETGHEACESPLRMVKISRGFWMAACPITQQQWQAIMDSNPSKYTDPQQPVEMVSWYDAQAFINRLNELYHGEFHLPTEAEWEYACRGGTTSRFYSGEDERDLDRIAWYSPNSQGYPHPAGEKDPNSYGLYDMHGNVFEWTADWFGPYSPDAMIDPTSPADGTKKVLRGGCCLCDPLNCRAANRYEKTPDGKNFNIGFRIVMIADSDADTESHIIEKGKIEMKKIQVYDPPMCCSTGVCGPSVNEKLVRFTADLDWLKGQGLVIERYNLSQQSGEFVNNSAVKTALEKDGNDCLPMILVNGIVARKSSYPSRSELVELAGIPAPLFTDQVREVVAIGAAIACNCETCFKYHYDKARKLGVTREDMLLAVQTAQMVKNSPAKSISELAAKYLDNKEPEVKNNTECGPG